MKQGTLVLDIGSGRMDIRFGLNDFYGGLHCGTSMEALVDGDWIPTRIEMGEDWFLVGIITSPYFVVFPSFFVYRSGSANFGAQAPRTLPLYRRTRADR